MYQKAGEKERIASLLIENARTAPNNWLLLSAEKILPEASDEKIRTSPELMMGMSMLQSLLLDIEESEHWYQELEQYAKEHSGGSGVGREVNYCNLESDFRTEAVRIW